MYNSLTCGHTGIACNTLTEELFSIVQSISTFTMKKQNTNFYCLQGKIICFSSLARSISYQRGKMGTTAASKGLMRRTQQPHKTAMTLYTQVTAVFHRRML